MISFADAYGRLTEDRPVPDDVRAAFESILEGSWNDVQVGAYACALRMRGEHFDVLVGAARALRAAMTPVDHGLGVVVDTCGTGGDGAHTINLSTAAAIVVASVGVHVGKHGNRAVSSRSGSADVLEALGVPLDVPPSRQADVLRAAKIAFLMAPAHHPALRFAAAARRQLGVRTIFNALGPLANPARATHQIVGVYADDLRPLTARALSELGVTAAWVVRGEDGLDEISPCGPTRVSVLSGGRIEEETVTPEDFGAPRLSAAAIAGGSPGENAEALRMILGGGDHPAVAAVALSAAATLVVARGDDPRRAYDAAREALASGRPAATLSAWIACATAAREAP